MLSGDSARKVAAIFFLFEEEVPEDVLVERTQALDDDERMFFVERLQVYAENLADDEAIPESIDDPIYARMREHGREYAPRLKSLLRRLAGGLKE